MFDDMPNVLIKIPDKFVLEREYTINTLFREICDIEIVVSNEVLNVEICYNDKMLIINDAFFKNKSEGKSFLDINNIPDKLLWFDYFAEYKRTIPIVYGENVFSKHENKLYCGLDIIASSFYMLSRWEEFVLPKDKYGRCDENEMFIVKHGISNRPIVNEYIELLRSILKSMGVKLFGIKREFRPMITHDIDFLFRYDLNNLCKNLAGDLLHRKSLRIAFSTLKNYIRFKRGKIKDPFDCFKELMDLSEKYGFKNHFYFKPGIPKEYNASYNIFDPRVKDIMNNIVKRGHYIGFHPSKNTYNNPCQFNIELDRLKSLGFQIKGGRQHYLLYELPKTIKVWYNNGLEYDGGLGFYRKAGFRCGICFDYNLWDVIERKLLPIVIKPLIVMDVALLNGKSKELFESIKNEMFNMVDIVNYYKGEFVFLWHNDNFKRYEARKYAYIYKEVVDYIYKKQISNI